MTKIPPIRMRRISVCVITASAPIAPPSPSEPVSPMKIEAGKALNQRNPMHAPTRQAESIERFSCSPVMKVIAVYASRTIAQQPAARPSRPSVRFTAFDEPAMTRKTNRRYRPSESGTVASATRICNWGSSPTSCRATHHSPMARPSWKRSFQRAESPSDLRLTSFRKSSANPIRAQPRATPSTARLAGSRSESAMKGIEIARKMIRPPMVGVPAFS